MKRPSYSLQLETARPLLEWLNDPSVNAGEKSPVVEFLLWNGRLEFRKPRKFTLGDELKGNAPIGILGGTVFKPNLVPITILRGHERYWQGRWRSEWVHLPEAGRNRASARIPRPYKAGGSEPARPRQGLCQPSRQMWEVVSSQEGFRNLSRQTLSRGCEQCQTEIERSATQIYGGS